MEHLYYNINVFNNEITDADNNPEISSTILENAQNYEMSVVRFQLNGVSNLPIFISRVEIGQSNPDKTNYKFILQFTYRLDGGSVKGPHDVIFTYTRSPERKTAPKASPPLTN